MNRYIAYFGAATTLTLCGMMSSCSNKEISELDIPRELYFEEDGHFDFATTRSVSVDVSYGPGLGALSLIQIYEEMPEDNPEAEPLYQAVTDMEGSFRSDVKLPSRVDQVWLVNHRFGVPEYVPCPIEDGRLSFRYSVGQGVRAAATRAAADYNQYVWMVDMNRKLYSIVSWDDQFGNVQGHPLVCMDDMLAGAEYTGYVNNLQQLLWRGKTSKPSNLDNSNMALGGDIVNTKVLDTFINAEGRLVDVESANLSLVFMSEGGWNQNALGYYYYPTGQAPKSPSEVKKFICLPNASKAGHYPYGGHKDAFHKDYQAPAVAGEKVQLLFEKPDGTFTPNFPPGYTVGYFIIANGFATKEKVKGEYLPNYTYYYSNEEWNASGTKRYIALSLPNGAIVYGMEDGTGDKSYEDVLFMIEGSPNEAIKNEEIPNIDPENKIIYYKDHTPTTYAFEDQWPQGGDYDLNDVVITHERILEYRSTDNAVRSVEDHFALKVRSASYSNAFAVQLNKNFIGSLTIRNGAGEDITSQVRHYSDPQNQNAETYILFEDVQKLREGDEFVISRTFQSTVSKSIIEKGEPTVNPFVISQFTDAAYQNGNMVEIHIPDFGNRTYKATSAGCSDDRYFYVERKGHKYYPYAISIPEKHFVSSDEKVCIDVTYPNFNQWVKSNGKESKDWYKK